MFGFHVPKDEWLRLRLRINNLEYEIKALKLEQLRDRTHVGSLVSWHDVGWPAVGLSYVGTVIEKITGGVVVDNEGRKGFVPWHALGFSDSSRDNIK